MTVWADNVLDGDGANTVLKELPNNNDTRYKFVDWKRMREAQAATANLLSVQLKTSGSPWETLKSLPVNSEGTTSYVLRPKINNVSHRLAVDVKLRDNIKYVTLRSTFVIRNDCLIGIELILKGPAKEYRGTYRIGESRSSRSGAGLRRERLLTHCFPQLQAPNSPCPFSTSPTARCKCGPRVNTVSLVY